MGYKIKRKGELAEVIYRLAYDVIVFRPDGTWDMVSTGYAGEQDPNPAIQPIYRISRTQKPRGLSRREVTEWIKEIETTINQLVEE